MVASSVSVEKLKVLLQDCSEHPDAPALRTAVWHGACTLSQVSESRGAPQHRCPSTRERLVGGVLCSPRPREERRRGQAGPSTCMDPPLTGSWCKHGWRTCSHWAGSGAPSLQVPWQEGLPTSLPHHGQRVLGPTLTQKDSRAEKGHGFPLNKEGWWQDTQDLT